MAAKRQIEIFSAGCPVCAETIARIKDIACSSCEVIVLDINTPEITERAVSLGIRSVPAVVIDGTLAACCSGRGPDGAILREAGLGKPLP